MVMARAYNDWRMEELCSYAPDRIIGLAVIPLDADIQDCVQEINRAAKLGHKGIFIPDCTEIPPWNDRYDPIWAACVENQITPMWHRAQGKRRFLPRGMGGGGEGASSPSDAPASVSARISERRKLEASTTSGRWWSQGESNP